MKTILLVDDEYAIVETLRDVLEWEGYRVLAASNGCEALEVMDHARPDIVLMDLMMPIMDGAEALRRIRQRSEYADIPVVILTAAPKSILQKPTPIPASAFLAKPFELAKLLDTVSRLLDRQH